MLETLNSYVPVIIRRRLAQNPQPLQAPEYQAFEAAVLFADISGFTALAERLARRGPQGVEQISNLLNEYFGWWIDLVTAYGGDVLKFAGDALLAAWPADEASGGLQAACLRAGSCILKARSVLRNEQKFQQSSLPEGARLTSRAGLAAGRVYLAHLGGAFGRWEVLVSGEPLTQASLAMQSVAPGEIGLAPNIEHILGSASQTALSNTGIPTLVGLEAGFATPGTDPAELFQAPEIAVGALQAYIPGAIKERLKAGQTGWLAELRTVSALFINLPGLGHGLALEKAQEIMQEVQSALYYYEGSLNKFSVDEKGTTMLAAFGLPPMAHEDDALRAGLAALEIERRLTALDVRCSIGICSGQAFCGSIGNLRRREYTLIGTAINLASRLMQAARVTNHPILVDRSTYERSYERLDFDELPPVMVKGKSEAVPVYTPRSERRFQIRRGVTMIGRQPERQRLLAGLEGLAAASGLQIGERVFIIEGEPGIGKSRLLEDLLEQAGMQGVPCLNSGGDAIEKATPYYAWRSIFAQLMGLDFAMPAAERQAQLAAALPADLSEQAPLLNEILQVDFSANDLTANLEGQVRAENTRLLLVTLLRRLVEARPHLIVIDDIHWLDTASWALSLDVARLAAEAPLMLAFTSRPLSDPAPLEYGLIQRLPQTVSLPLLRLEGEQALELVLQRLGVNDLPRPVKSLILEKAEGHPFFSEELAYALRDTGVLLIENGASRLAPGYDDLDALNLPNSVQGVITSRIDRLSPTQQLSLKVASVIGRVFSYLALNAIYPIDQERPQLRASLVALEKLDITPLETPDPDLKYIFKHSITREVAYNLMLFAQRRQLHQAIGEWYEQTFAIDLEPHYPLLAHHYHLAENAPKAVDYLEKAGQQALLSGAYLEAADFYAEALRVAERSAGELALAPERRASWHRQLGEACLGLGDLGRSRENLEAAARLLGWPSPPEKGKLLGRLLLQAGRQITRLLRGSHTRLSSRRENLLEAARTHERLTEIYYFLQDRPRMLNSSLHALNLSEKAGPSPELARAYANMCVVAGVVRAHGLARGYERRPREVAGHMEKFTTRARGF